MAPMSVHFKTATWEVGDSWPVCPPAPLPGERVLVCRCYDCHDELFTIGPNLARPPPGASVFEHDLNVPLMSLFVPVSSAGDQSLGGKWCGAHSSCKCWGGGPNKDISHFWCDRLFRVQWQVVQIPAGM